MAQNAGVYSFNLTLSYNPITTTCKPDDLLITLDSIPYIAAIVQPDWAATDPDMGFFDSVYLVGGPVFYKIMLLVNIVAVGIANIINAQMASSRLLYSMGRDGVIPRVFSRFYRGSGRAFEPYGKAVQQR